MNDDDISSLIRLAHSTRLSLKKPSQSYFRVVSIISYEDFDGNVVNLFGANIESVFIGGSICAERAALCKLRMAHNVKSVLSILIVSDALFPLSPGLLCREFLSSYLDRKVPVIMSGSSSDFESIRCDVGDLYPFQSIYTNVERKDLLQFGASFSEKMDKIESYFEGAKLLETYSAAKEFIKYDSNHALHPISYAAAVLFDDGQIEAACQLKAAEYGSTLDPVSQLVRLIIAKGRENVEPKFLIQVDQFGIMHAPFATARALLAEQGHDGICCVVHGIDGKIKNVTIALLVPKIGSYVTDELICRASDQKTECC